MIAPTIILRSPPACVIFFVCLKSLILIKEGVVGTTKLTRKEILSDDPIRERIIRLFGLFQINRAKIGAAVLVVIVLAIGFWAWSFYLDSRADAAGAMLGRGMTFFIANVSPDADENDPFAAGDTPRFISDEAKYQAAAKEFSAAAASFVSSSAIFESTYDFNAIGSATVPGSPAYTIIVNTASAAINAQAIIAFFALILQLIIFL